MSQNQKPDVKKVEVVQEDTETQVVEPKQPKQKRVVELDINNPKHGNLTDSERQAL